MTALLATVATGSMLPLADTALGAAGDVTQVLLSPSPAPTGMAFDGELLWTADPKTDSIYALDYKDGHVVMTRPAPTGKPLGLTCEVGSVFWVVDGDRGKLVQFDIKTGQVLNILNSPVFDPMSLAWDGEHLWLAARSYIYKLSTENGHILKSINAPASKTSGLTYHNSYLWTADKGRDRIFMIDPLSGEIINILDAPGASPQGLAVIDGRLFNADNQAAQVFEISIEDSRFMPQSSRLTENLKFFHEASNLGPDTLESVDIYMAIPESSCRQVIHGEPVYFADVTPTYVTDRWGQPFAAFRFYNVEPGQTVKASYMVSADLYESRIMIYPENVGSLANIPDDIRERYLGDDVKFDIYNPVIQEAAQKAVGQEQNPYWMTRRIYSWVLDNMEYEMSGGWDAAPKVIERGDGSCSEYSFVLIALCRAVGIPARYNGAVAVQENSPEDRTFHRWAEVYLPNYGWIPVDASGGDATSPEERALCFGTIDNVYLITTIGSGSDYMGWEYNSSESWQPHGQSNIFSDHYGVWSPANAASTVSEAPPEGGQYCRPQTDQQ